MLQVSKCLIGLAVMMLQSCDVVDNRRDMLCGNWESVEGKPRCAYLQGGRSLQGDGVPPERSAPQAETGNLSLAGGKRQPCSWNTGFRIDVSYNEATDVLTFSPGGDYVRVKPQPGHPTEE